jgi:hypothetical protein
MVDNSTSPYKRVSGWSNYPPSIETVPLGIIPTNRNVVAITEEVQWNYTSVLNIIFLFLAAVLVTRFIRTGGLPMLCMMSKPAQDMSHHEMG